MSHCLHSHIYVCQSCTVWYILLFYILQLEMPHILLFYILQLEMPHILLFYILQLEMPPLSCFNLRLGDKPPDPEEVYTLFYGPVIYKAIKCFLCPCAPIFNLQHRTSIACSYNTSGCIIF